MTASDYLIEERWTSQLNTSDIDGILSCFQSAFGEDTLRRNFNWKYTENPFGESLHLLTIFEGEIVAARSFWQLDTGLDILQCVDTSVKKEHQGKGVFKKNIDYLFSKHPRLRLYNYPNSSSMRQYLKYGWNVTHDYYIKYNFSSVLEKSAPSIDWEEQELKWRFANDEVRGRYFLSIGSSSNIYLWGIRRGRYPVLLGRINYMIPLPIRDPYLGFSYDNLPGLPVLRRVRYVATGAAGRYCSFFRFDMC